MSFMIRTMFTTVLLCVGVLFQLPVIGQWNQTPSFTLSRSDTSIEYMKVFRNINDCPPDVDECTKVTAPRITCPVGAVCTEGRPSSIPCVSGLTANPDAPISSPYGEESWRTAQWHRHSRSKKYSCVCCKRWHCQCGGRNSCSR